MNFIDAFLSKRLNVELHGSSRPDLIKNVPIEEILNINPVESISPKIQRRLRSRTIHSKNDKEKIYTTEYAPSKSALNINTNKKIYSSNVLGENSLLNLTSCRRSTRLRNKLNTSILNNSIYQSSVIIKPLKQSEILLQSSLNKNVNNNSGQSEVINYSNSHEDLIKSTHLNNSKILKLACNGKNTNASNAKKCVASIKSLSDLVENKNCAKQKIKRKTNDNKPKISKSKKAKPVCNSKNSSTERLHKEIKNTKTSKKEKEITLTQSKKPIEKDLKPKDKKIAKLGTLKYLKERQNFMKSLLLEENPTDYMEACGRKKNKALENLVKLGVDETLSIKTPKEKGKGKEVYCGMTPRTALLNDWSEAIGCPTWTPKDVPNSKSKQENEKDALKVLYHHLKAKPSRKNKADWTKLRTPVKISKKMKGKENYLNYSMNFEDAEKKVIDYLSEKPSKTLNDSNSDDDYFNLSE